MPYNIEIFQCQFSGTIRIQWVHCDDKNNIIAIRFYADKKNKNLLIPAGNWPSIKFFGTRLASESVEPSTIDAGICGMVILPKSNGWFELPFKAGFEVLVIVTLQLFNVVLLFLSASGTVKLSLKDISTECWRFDLLFGCRINEFSLSRSKWLLLLF